MLKVYTAKGLIKTVVTEVPLKEEQQLRAIFSINRELRIMNMLLLQGFNINQSFNLDKMRDDPYYNYIDEPIYLND